MPVPWSSVPDKLAPPHTGASNRSRPADTSQPGPTEKRTTLGALQSPRSRNPAFRTPTEDRICLAVVDVRGDVINSAAIHRITTTTEDVFEKVVDGRHHWIDSSDNAPGGNRI